MPQTDKNINNDGERVVNKEHWPETESSFRLIVVAALRAKQLLHGARPRIAADSQRRRNTSIALEEVRQGLVPFTLINKDRENGGGSVHE